MRSSLLSLLSLPFFLYEVQAVTLQNDFKSGPGACENATFTWVYDNPRERPPFHIQILDTNNKSVTDLGNTTIYQSETFWQVKAPPGVLLRFFIGNARGNRVWFKTWEFNVTEGSTSCMSEMELNAFFLSTTLPPGSTTLSTSATSTSFASQSSSLNATYSTLPSESSSAMDQIPSAAIIGGTIGGVLLLLFLIILAIWLRCRKVQSRRRRARLPIQSPSLSPLTGRGSKHLTLIPSLSSSVTQIAVEPTPISFVGQQELLTSPVSPAVQSSMIFPFESRPESRLSTASTIVPSSLPHAYAY